MGGAGMKGIIQSIGLFVGLIIYFESNREFTLLTGEFGQVRNESGQLYNNKSHLKRIYDLINELRFFIIKLKNDQSSDFPSHPKSSTHFLLNAGKPPQHFRIKQRLEYFYISKDLFGEEFYVSVA